jgi:hypothetical protein
LNFKKNNFQPFSKVKFHFLSFLEKNACDLQLVLIDTMLEDKIKESMKKIKTKKT